MALVLHATPTWAQGSITPPNLAGPVAGSLPGTPGVGPSGAAQYSIPLPLPPGTAGVVPPLGLQYSSQSGPSLLGLGWSVTGLASITRCARTKTQDGIARAVALSAQDAFCFNGSRLMLVAGTHGQNAEYRTEVDGFAKILSFGTDAAKGPDRWEVWSRSGVVMHLGSTADSSIEAQGRTPVVVLTWALARAQDRRGNFYTVSYGRDTAEGAFWPVQLSYTGNGAMAPYNAVRFEYDDRTEDDKTLGYVVNARLSILKRLRNIKAFVNIAADGSGGTLVRDFRIAYTSNPATGRSLVDSISDCDAAGNCLPATRFSWTRRTAADDNFDAPGGGDWGGPPAQVSVPSTGTAEQKARGMASQVAEQVLIGDYNGDGRTDLVSSHATGTWRMCLSVGNGFNCADWAGPVAQSYDAFTGDFNGDGMTDIAVPPPTTMAGATPWQICLSTGSAFNCAPWAAYMIGALRDGFLVGDFDGDGRDDIVMGRDGLPEKRCLSTGSAAGGFSCTDYAGVVAAISFAGGQGTEEVGRSALPVAVDMDGDGRSEVFKVLILGSLHTLPRFVAGDTGFTTMTLTGNTGSGTNGAVRNLQFPTTGGTWFADLTADPYQSYPDSILAYPVPDVPSLSRVRHCQYKGAGQHCISLPISSSSADDFRNETFSDVDGDGRPDGVHWNATRGQWRVCRLNARASSYVCADWGNSINPANYTARYFGDFNGDGKIDLAYYDRNTARWTVKLANGPKPDLLVSVTNGSGLETRFTYKPQTDASVYTRDRGAQAAQWPQRDMQPATYVVSRQSVTNAQGGWLDTDYAYGGLKLDLQGRGLLGHRWRRTTDVVSGVQSYEESSQNFPTAGLPTLELQLSRSGVELLRSTNVYASKATTGAATYFSFVASRSEVRKDLNGAPQATTQVTVDPASGYDGYGNLLAQTTSTSANGDTYTASLTRRYDNDPANWLIGQERSRSETRTAPGMSAVTRSTASDYTEYGELLRETAEPDDPALRLQAEYGHDAFGNVNTRTLRWTDPRSGAAQSRVVEAQGFDAQGRFALTLRNALEQAQSRSFSEAHGAMTSRTDANGQGTTWEHDGWGRQVREAHADGTATTQAYRGCIAGCNGGSTVLVTQHWAGTAQSAVPSEEIRDVLGRVVRTRSWGFDGAEILSDRQHDAQGRLQNASRPYKTGSAPVLYSFEHDDLGRRTRVTEPGDSGPVSTGVAYDGQMVTITNALGQTRSERRNALGQADRVTDAAGQATTYQYEPWGNLAGTTDALGNRIQASHDTLGRKTRLQDPDLGTWNYLVDPLGQTWRQTDGRNQITDFWHDALGRLVRRLAPDQDARFEYDTAPQGVGELAEAYTLTGTGQKDYRRTHAYDSLGRPAATTVTLDQDYVTRLGYGTDGRLASERHERNGIGSSGGPGVTLRYDYNTLGYLAQIRGERSNGQSVVDWAVQAQDAEQRVTQERLGSGLVTRRGFNPRTGRLERVQTGLGSADSTMQDDTYQYDAIGNLGLRTQRATAAGGYVSETFGYDNLNRLTRSQVAGQAAKTAGYDELGNLKSKSGTGSYTYPASGAGSVRPHAVSSIEGSVNGVANPSFGYDGNGNLISGAGRSVSWTSFNQPASLNTTGTAGPASSGFLYGPEQQRIRQSISEPGGSSTIVYTGSMEKESKAGVVTLRTYLPRGLGFIEEVGGATTGTRYYHKDHLGSPIAITSETSAEVARLSYDPWGKRRQADGSDDLGNSQRNPADHAGYTGHEHLESQGLIHMNGRVYDPVLGRFMSADPTVADVLDGQQLNRYSYVLNNPFSYTDPSGFTAQNPTDVTPDYAPGGSGVMGSVCRAQISCETVAPGALGSGGPGSAMVRAIYAALTANEKQFDQMGRDNPKTPEEWQARRDRLVELMGKRKALLEALGMAPDAYYGSMSWQFVVTKLMLKEKLDDAARQQMAMAGIVLGSMGQDGQPGGVTKAKSKGGPLFRNLAPADEIVPAVLFPASQIQKVGYSGRLTYVVTQSGELVIGRTGHISLSRGADVLAAGEARFVNGGLRTIDNASGHYQPNGASAQNAAEAAFRGAGFDGFKYIERTFP